MDMTFERQRELDRFVQNEVKANVTGLLVHLAEVHPEDIPSCQYDYQESAEENGWSQGSDGKIRTWCEAYGNREVDSWEDACSEDNILPYEREIFSFYVVSSFLADDLEDKGEVVLRDFYGLDIWGRTIFGQAISLDHVIQNIYDELQTSTTKADKN